MKKNIGLSSFVYSVFAFLVIISIAIALYIAIYLHFFLLVSLSVLCIVLILIRKQSSRFRIVNINMKPAQKFKINVGALMKKKQKEFLLLISITAGLCIGEQGLRLWGVCDTLSESAGWKYSYYFTPSEQGWFHLGGYNPSKPGEISRMKRPEFTQESQFNSLGLNGTEWHQTSDSSCRILTLGDSFTQGYGTGLDSTYPKLLQSLLSKTEVLNAGVAGSDPIFCEILLKEKLLSYHPNIVTVTFNLSDICDIMTRGGNERFLPDGTLRFKDAPWWEDWYANFRIVRVIVHHVFKMDYLFMTKQEHDIGVKKVMEILDKFTDRFSILCKKNNIRAIFIFHPLCKEVCSGYMELEPVMQYAKGKGYETVDILRSFQQQGMTKQNAQRYYWPIDHHNNSDGYRLFAKGLAEYLEQNPSPQHL